MRPFAGQRLVGRVVDIVQKGVVVDLGDGRTGIVATPELCRRHGCPSEHRASLGGKLAVEIVERDPSVGWRLSVERLHLGGDLDVLLASGDPVAVRVTQTMRNGLRVKVLGRHGFIPGGLVDLERHDRLDSFYGKTFEARIVEWDPTTGRLILDRRGLLEEQRRERVRARLERLKAGDRLTARITGITPEGIFAEDGELSIMVPHDERSWPGEGRPRYEIGESIRTVVLSVDWPAEQVVASVRALRPEPWVAFERTHQVGDLIRGSVRRVTTDGALILLAPGVYGLVRRSEYPLDLAEDDTPRVGEEVWNRITSLDGERRRIGLSMRVEGVPTLTDERRWAAAGISKDEIGDWVASGIPPEEASEWAYYGFAATTAGAWRAIGWTASHAALWRPDLPDPAVAARWTHVVDDPKEAAAWIEAEVPIEDVPLWIDSRFDPAGARSWSVLPPGLAGAWAALGIGPDEALRWSAGGFTPEAAEPWIRAGISAIDHEAWASLALGLDAARRWLRLDVTAADARSWLEDGWNADEAAPWLRKGWTPRPASRWRGAGFSAVGATAWHQAGATLRTAQEWTAAGFSAVAAAPWIERSWTSSTAARWRRAGWAAPEASRWLEAGWGDPDAAARWRNLRVSPEFALRATAAGVGPDLLAKASLPISEPKGLVAAGRGADRLLGAPLAGGLATWGRPPSGELPIERMLDAESKLEALLWRPQRRLRGVDAVRLVHRLAWQLRTRGWEGLARRALLSSYTILVPPADVSTKFEGDPPPADLMPEVRLPFDIVTVVFGARFELADRHRALLPDVANRHPSYAPWLAHLHKSDGALRGAVLFADPTGVGIADDVLWLMEVDGTQLAIPGQRHRAAMGPLAGSLAAAICWAGWLPSEHRARDTARRGRSGPASLLPVPSSSPVHVVDIRSRTTARTGPGGPGWARSAHIRRGHWRRVRVGPRSDPRLEPRWIDATYVNGRPPEDGPRRVYRLPSWIGEQADT